MTLQPRAPKQAKKRFATYDLEWSPSTMKFRLCGVYDEQQGYRCYASMSAFLASELRPENYGVTFYAHNGGKSDMQYVLHELVTSGLAEHVFEVDAAFNGSSAFLVTLTDRSNPKNRFVFADTLFLLKSSLAKIGEWLGYEKFKVDFETENWNELKWYNERDCMLLYEAVKQLEAELHEMGGEFKVTLASCAMALFQTKYLQTIIPTDHSTNEHTRGAYYASRVEVFTRECERGMYADVNSSFPWSMKQVLPGRFLRMTGSLREKPKGAACYIAEASVHVKECYLPPLPFRDKLDRILFPTGRWRGMFCDTDLQLMEEMGHTIEQIHSVSWFEGFTDLGGYVDDLYEKKATAKGFRREVYKLLLNSLYGKFAEMGLKKKLLVHPHSVECPHKYKHHGNACMAMMRPGFWTREDFMPLQHVHVPIPAAVTAHSRALLYRYLKNPLDAGGQVYYSDTDSIVYSVPCKHSPKHGDEMVPFGKGYAPAWQVCMTSAMPTGEAVGELKMEYAVDRGHFAAPKLYMIEADGKIVVKSKGFSKLEGYEYMQLCAGESVVLYRMAGIRENIRDEDLTPRQVQIAKYARFKKNKRADVGKTGQTRPWTIDEIRADGG